MVVSGRMGLNNAGIIADAAKAGLARLHAFRGLKAVTWQQPVFPALQAAGTEYRGHPATAPMHRSP